MLIFINGKQIKESIATENNKSAILCIAELSDKQQLLSKYNFKAVEKGYKPSTCFESYNGYDYMSFMMPITQKSKTGHDKIEIFFSKDKLLIFYEHCNIIEELIQSIKQENVSGLEETLYQFFLILIESYVIYLEKIEDQIAALEDLVATNSQVDYVSAISVLRKNLLTIKRYYESLVVLMEGLEENINGLLSDEMIRLFHFQTKKADRQYHSILNLRDYVTQVRESYQAQMDIELNKIMKLFTVITTIFLPLTLIVGWYGMNFSMPEYASRYSYPTVIAASVAVIVGCIIYFKKHKWF